MIYNKDLHVLHSLSHLAYLNKICAGAKISAAIVYKSEIIVLGFNKYKSHPIMLKFASNKSRIFLHAEADAIRKATKFLSEDELRKSCLYVCRVLKNGAWGISKPCDGCMNMIRSFEINRIIYSSNGKNSYVSMSIT
jgi:deoxycytidylate deaminase